MNADLFLTVVIEPALLLLPPKMNRDDAKAMLMTIALQESGLSYRKQLNGGPAHGYYMFEPSGIAGVLRHPSTREHVEAVLLMLDYNNLHDRISSCYNIVEHHDVLATIFARLLLWSLPERLANRDEPELGWSQYLKCWRPGKPRPEAWAAHFNEAWSMVLGT